MNTDYLVSIIICSHRILPIQLSTPLSVRMVVPASPNVCFCTSNWYGIRCTDLKLLELMISLAGKLVVKSVHCSLMQLSVAHPVLMEVPALLLVDAPVLLNGLGPLVQLVRLRSIMC